MPRKRCPDTGQMLEFPVDCMDCEFLKTVSQKKVCGFKLKPKKHKQVW